MSGLEGTSFGPYQLKQLLGQGGMAEVYLAYDTVMEREVAVKVIGVSVDDCLERLRREAEAIDKLHHEHILPAFDYDDQEPWHYLVMLYAPGGTLRDRLKEEPLTPEDAGEMLDQIASALQYAHDHGIIHRDIKPSNILLRDNHYAYLADFGLAKIVEETGGITRTGTLMGTPEYMAPDLADGPATTSSDIYALGVLLYQMVTGSLPFTGETPVAVYWKHLCEQPLRPSQLNSKLSRAIDHVIFRALEKEPGKRFQQAQDVADAYRQALTIKEEEAPVYEAVALYDEASAPEIAPLPSFEDISAPFKATAAPIQTSSYGSARKMSSRGRTRRSSTTKNLPFARSQSRAREKYTPPVSTLPPLPMRRSQQKLPIEQTVPPPETIQSPASTPQQIPKRTPPRSRKSTMIMVGIIGCGLLIFIVLPMSYIYYIYATHGENTTTTANRAQSNTTTTNAATDHTFYGTLLLSDNLSRNTNGRWAENSMHCHFTNNAYDVAVDGTLYACVLHAPQIDNTVMQVDVSLRSSNSAGLLLRLKGEQYYDFEITHQGQFFFLRHDATGRTVTLIDVTSSNAILSGAAKNTLLVIARQDDFKLYINGAFVGEVHDSTYSSGQVALAATATSPTATGESSFTNFALFKTA